MKRTGDDEFSQPPIGETNTTTASPIRDAAGLFEPGRRERISAEMERGERTISRQPGKTFRLRMPAVKTD